MRFRNYNSLRVFEVVARHLSFTAAAGELNLTKGAVSYQMNQLERELRFALFIRRHRGIDLTEKGRQLWHASQVAFRDVEREVVRLREQDASRIVIGMSTYFGARWLISRLMTFMAEHPSTGLRIQPLIDLIDPRVEDLDMAIRWGNGQWTDMEIEQLFISPAFPTAGAMTARMIRDEGLKSVLPRLVLLQDRDGSTAWSDWHEEAELPYRSTRDNLVIPDPNVRVQAVVNDQGIALNDDLVAHELAQGQLFKVSEVELTDYGYFLAYRKSIVGNPSIRAFRDWIMKEAMSQER